MRAGKEREKPVLLERLREIHGSYGKLCKALSCPDNYPMNWRRAGYIPERWALDIHRLNVRDQWGQITAMTVLYEAEEARLAMIRKVAEGEG